jgi:ABC-type nitrate/sulfonate/bicarbonate transport system substrate-binding protein
MAKILRMGPSCYHVLHIVPPTVAHEMNFFYDEGLRDQDGDPAYELIPGSHAPFMFEQLTLGQTMKERGIDVSMDVKPSTVATLQQHGHEIYIVAGWRNQQPHFVVGGKGIAALKDIKGKRVGIIDIDDVLQVVLSYYLKQAGIEEQDVTWVRGIDPRRAPAALRDGRIDVGFLDAVEIRSMLDEGYNLILDIQKQYPQGRPDRVIAATGKALREKPEQVTSFIKGMIRAYWFLRTMPENIQVTQAIERRLRRQSPDPDEPKRLPQFGSADHAEMMPFPYDGLPTGIEQYLDEQLVTGRLEKRAKADDLVRLDFARAAFAELSSRTDVRADLERAKQVAAKYGY